ncbi:unnamed protein product [Eruca vesicaria subsp. sativa]|uniref:Uncharacterized protein n=1 Tax=Eruca vesicaria subsp. sativa TaxID=29727 RepID=A0ABC8L914_ERUVS|nr:unnamed protein product [Eruca vesicaria subsp. sativa]
MTDRFNNGGYTGPPVPLCGLLYPSPHPSSSASPFLPTYPLNLSQGVFDPMISHGSYLLSPSDRSNNSSYGGPSLPQTTPSSSFYVNNSRPGSFDHRGSEDSYTNMLPTSGLYTSRETYDVAFPTDYPVDSSATVSSSADMLIRNSEKRFFKRPIPSPSSGLYGSGLDEKRLRQYHDGCDRFEIVDTVFDKSQTSHDASDNNIQSQTSHDASDNNIQSSFHGSSSVEPVNFNVLLGYGEVTGHANPDRSSSPRASHTLQFDSSKCSGSPLKEKQEGSGVSSLYHTPKTFVTDSENGGVSETSLKNVIDDLNCDEHISWKHFMVGPSAPTMFDMGSESCVAMKADNSDDNQPSEDVEASEKTDLGIKGNSKSNADDVSTGQPPERQGDLRSLDSCPRVSSVVNAMHNLSEVLVYECFDNGNWLNPEKLESLDKVVENITKCLKKITGNKTVTVEASIPTPTQAVHVSCPNVGDLNEASNVVAKECEGFNVKPLGNSGLKEPVDKNMYEDEMTQSIKNILATNFPDGEENHPQTLLYKSLWLETEAALCSKTCMTRYHRIKKEIDNLKLQNREISADASTFMQEPFLNSQKPVSVMNSVEQETSDSFIRHGSNSGNDILKTSHDAPQSSRFNSDSVDSVLLGLMSRSFTGGLGQEDHGNFKPDAATSGKIPDTTRKEKHNDVIDRFQILKQQETKRKLKSQNCDQEENPEASEVANIGRSSQMSDVMDRFKILKRREAEKVQESLNSLDSDSDSEPRNKTQICEHLWSDSMVTIGGNSVTETCAANTEEPSASGEGCESPTSDWEHVGKDN